MNNSIKIWLIIATCFTLIGLVLFCGLMTMLKWDFTKLSTTEYETNSYEITKEFNSITINTDTSDIEIVPSNDSKCSVVCYEQKKLKHSVEVKEGALVIEVNDTKKWYEYVAIDFKSAKITVYLPKTEYSSLFIKESTGDISVSNDFTFEEVDLSLSTGDVSFSASSNKFIKIKTSTGDVDLQNVNTPALNLSVSTGKITASGVNCDGDINILK